MSSRWPWRLLQGSAVRRSPSLCVTFPKSRLIRDKIRTSDAEVDGAFGSEIFDRSSSAQPPLATTTDSLRGQYRAPFHIGRHTNSAAAPRWNVGPEDVMLLEKVFEVEKCYRLYLHRLRRLHLHLTSTSTLTPTSISTSTSSSASTSHPRLRSGVRHHHQSSTSSFRCPGRTVRAELAARLRVSPRQIQVWFQNKRQRTRAGAKPTVAESIAHETRDTEMAAHEAVAALMSMRHADLSASSSCSSPARESPARESDDDSRVTAAPPPPLPAVVHEPAPEPTPQAAAAVAAARLHAAAIPSVPPPPRAAGAARRADARAAVALAGALGLPHLARPRRGALADAAPAHNPALGFVGGVDLQNLPPLHALPVELKRRYSSLLATSALLARG